MAEHKAPSKPRRPWRGDVPHVCGLGAGRAGGSEWQARCTEMGTESTS